MVHDHHKDTNDVGVYYMEAICNVKTIRINESKYVYTVNKWNFCSAAGTKVMTVRRDYTQSAQKLDIACAENYTTHPFVEA